MVTRPTAPRTLDWRVSTSLASFQHSFLLLLALYYFLLPSWKFILFIIISLALSVSLLKRNFASSSASGDLRWEQDLPRWKQRMKNLINSGALEPLYGWMSSVFAVKVTSFNFTKMCPRDRYRKSTWCRTSHQMQSSLKSERPTSLRSTGP